MSTPPPPQPPSPSPQPPGTPQQAYPATYPRPQVVHVVSKPTSFGRVLMILAGLAMFGAVFVVGIVFGVGIMFAGSQTSDVIIPSAYRDGGSRKVAIIPVRGTIHDGTARFVHSAVDYILDDRSIRAVVLRVDSGGGGVTASDQIWNEIERLKNAGLPIVASYGGMAASGGYYISCGADHIIAERTCTTGSIGVIAQVLTMGDLMDKVGIEPVTLVATDSPDKDVANDIYRDWTEEDRAKLRTMLDAAYATFNERVAEGRLDVIGDQSKIDAIADGSIFTAAQAQELGLIDSVGYLDDAIAEAERRAALAGGTATVVELNAPPTLLGGLLGIRQASSEVKLDADSLRNLVNDLAAPRIMYLMH